MNIHAQRLMNVSRALRETPKPKRFDMGKFGNPCGTPACALGHYAVRTDMQSTFRLSFWTGDLKVRGQEVDFDGPQICHHFGITEGEAALLFGPSGCNDAQFPEDAAAYIEAFVTVKWPTKREPGLVKLVEQLELSR